MRTSVIAGQDISRAILIFLVIITFVFIAGAVYVAMDILPGKGLFPLSCLVAGMTILTAILTWQPKVAMPLLIISVFFSPDIVVAQIPGRPVNLRVEDGIIVAALLGLLIRYAAGRAKISIRTPLDKPILAYCAVGLVSTLVGMYLGNVSALRGLFFFAKRVEYFMLFYLMYHYLEGKNEIKAAIYLVFLCILAISVYDAYMRLTTQTEIERWRAFGPPGNLDRSTEYGELLVMILPIVIAIAAETRTSFHITFAAVASPLMAYLLLDTLRRSAFVGAGVALLFLAIFRYRLLSIPLVGAVYYSIAYLPQRVIRRILFLWEELAQYPKQGGSFPLRMRGVKESLSIFLYRPLIGRGLGTYSLACAISHNQYSQFLSEVGILGMGAFLWLIVSLVRLCWRGIKESEVTDAFRPTVDNLHRGYFIGFLAGLIGWLVMNLGTISFTSIRTMEFFMVMTAVLTACVESNLHREDNPRIPLV